MNPFSSGDWVRWTTPHHIKEGQVSRVEGPSIVVDWMGGEQQVFPTVDGYLPPMASAEYRIEIVSKPQRADRIERDQRRGHMSVARAAAILGTEPKRIRAMLRSGQIRGAQVDGKWAKVDSDDVMRKADG